MTGTLAKKTSNMTNQLAQLTHRDRSQTLKYY